MLLGQIYLSIPYEAEAIATLQALRWAEKKNLSHVMFEGNASNVIFAVTGLDDFLE